VHGKGFAETHLAKGLKMKERARKTRPVGVSFFIVARGLDSRRLKIRIYTVIMKRNLLVCVCGK
jgi:hypothetical protein